MATGRPVTQEDRDAVQRLHAEGMSRGAVARKLGRPPSTVGKIADRLGLSWDRSKTAVAVAAKQTDNRARRAILISRMYDRADTVLSRLEADEFKATADWEGRVLVSRIPADAIPARDEKALGGMAANYLLAAARLEAIDGDNGAEQAKGMLGQLADGLQSLYGQLSHAGEQ